MSTYEKDVRYGQGASHVQYWNSPDGVNRENVARFVSTVGSDIYRVEEDDASIYVDVSQLSAVVILPPLPGVRNGQGFLIQCINTGGVPMNSVTVQAASDEDLINEAAPGPYVLSHGNCQHFRKAHTNENGHIVLSWYTCVHNA